MDLRPGVTFCPAGTPLRVDPELRDLLPVVAGDELSRQIGDEGPRDAILVYADPDAPDEHTIWDGYRRYAECERRNLPFGIMVVEFANRHAAAQEMVANQFARRNASAYERAKTVEKLRRMIERDLKEAHVRAPVTKATKQVAGLANVSKRTAQRYKQAGAARDRLTPALRECVDREMNGLGTPDLCRLAELPQEQQEDLLAQVHSGEFRTIRAALRGEAPAEIIRQDMIDEREIEHAEPRPAGSIEADPEKVLVNFKRATEQLGQLGRLIDRLGDMRPGPFYQKVRDNLDKAGLWLQNWRKWKPDV